MIDTPHIFFEDEMGGTCGMYGGEEEHTNTNEGDHLDDIGLDGRIILK